MRVFLITDKWDTYTVDATETDTAALKILTERVEDGFWYQNWDDGNDLHQYEDRARRIVEVGSGRAAWKFLQERDRDGFEYEDIELQEVR